MAHLYREDEPRSALFDISAEKSVSRLELHARDLREITWAGTRTIAAATAIFRQEEGFTRWRISLAGLLYPVSAKT